MNVKLRNITNDFQDVQLLSLASWRQANQIFPRDHGGPYVVTQEGYDPADMTMTADEFIIGRSGKWIRLGLFFRLPIPERRAEFVFGTASEVMRMMYDLPAKAQIAAGKPGEEATPGIPEKDEMAAAFQAGKQRMAAK